MTKKALENNYCKKYGPKLKIVKEEVNKCCRILSEIFRKLIVLALKCNKGIRGIGSRLVSHKQKTFMSKQRPKCKLNTM